MLYIVKDPMPLPTRIGFPTVTDSANGKRGPALVCHSLEDVEYELDDVAAWSLRRCEDEGDSIERPRGGD